jgi:transposase
VQRTGITKAGASDLRFALVQGAWTLLRCRPNEPMSRWALRIAERRNRKIAVIALARKLVGVLWSMWRHSTDYDASKTTSQEVV